MGEQDILIPLTLDVRPTGWQLPELPKVEITPVEHQASPTGEQPQLPEDLDESIATILEIFSRECS
jgi:hypothetical protein